MNAAPPEQQYEGYLQGNENIVLRGLLPSRTEQICQLPGIRILAQLHYRGVSDPESCALQADTLTVNTDEECLTLIWRLTLPIHSLPECVVLLAEQEALHG